MALKKGVKLPATNKKVEKTVNPLSEKRTKQFGIGGVRRFVKWPHVVRIQTKKTILKQRLKASSPIHQFSKILDKNLGNFLHLTATVY